MRRIGVNEKDISKVIGDEYVNAQGLFDDKFNLAYNELLNTVSKEVKGTKFANNIIDHRVVGERSEGTTEGAPADEYSVFVMEVDCSDGDVDLSINNIALHLQYTGEITLKIWNLKEGGNPVEVVTNVVDGVLKTVDISEVIRGKGRHLKVAIGYESAGITAEKYKMTGDCLRCGIKKCGRHVQGFGANYNPTTGKITRTAHMAGMSVDYSLVCAYEGFICANASSFATPLLYLIGSEMMIYALNTGRFNDYETTKAHSNLDWFSKKLNESLNVVLKGINLPTNGCFGCRSRFGAVTLVP